MTTAYEEPKTCPQCGETLSVLLFLGLFPDGFICITCKLYYGDDLTPLAHVIEGDSDVPTKDT